MTTPACESAGSRRRASAHQLTGRWTGAGPDRQQLLLHICYVQDSILWEIVASSDEIRQLRARTFGLPAARGVAQRRRLAELLARELAARRAADLDRLIPELTGQVMDWTVRAQQGTIAGLMDLVVLVDDAQRVRFEHVVDELRWRLRGRMTFELTRAVVPFDFALAD